MKNVILVVIFVLIISYLFVPNETKISLLEKVGIDSSFVSKNQEEVKNIDENGVVNLKFDDIAHKANYSGNISSGKVMQDLSWASLQFVNCFDKNKYENFGGNMVLHRILLGKNKSVDIKLISDSPSLSMYVYKTDALSKIYPPEIEYVHDCIVKLSSEELKEITMKGNTITSDIVVGVSGGNGVNEGNYTLELEEK